MPYFLQLIKSKEQWKMGCFLNCGLFLDLSKAFDTVNHDVLISKLQYYGICGISNDWFTSYLKDRKQFTSIGNVTSDQRPILCGVPQGSVLGPLLFLLYINDFPNCAKALDTHLFADDCNIFYAQKSPTLSSFPHIKQIANYHLNITINRRKIKSKGY